MRHLVLPGCLVLAGLTLSAGIVAHSATPDSTAPETALPDGAPGRELALFLEAFNSGDHDRLRAVVASRAATSTLK